MSPPTLTPVVVYESPSGHDDTCGNVRISESNWKKKRGTAELAYQDPRRPHSRVGTPTA